MNSNSYSWVSDDKKNCTNNNNNNSNTRKIIPITTAHTNTNTISSLCLHLCVCLLLSCVVFSLVIFFWSSKKLNARLPHFCPFAFYILSTSCIIFSVLSLRPHIFLWYCCCCRFLMCPCYSIWICTLHSYSATHTNIHFFYCEMCLLCRMILSLSHLFSHIHTHTHIEPFKPDWDIENGKYI